MSLNLSLIISSAMRAEGVGMEEILQLWASVHNRGTFPHSLHPISGFWLTQVKAAQKTSSQKC